MSETNSTRGKLLTGGNVSHVYRVENTVRRNIKVNSMKVHDLLRYLEKRGFQYSARFIGIDEKGREVLSYIEGEAGTYPLRNYMWSDACLIEIAKMLRSYHDAVRDFSFSGWDTIDNTPEPYEVLCHNDFAIYNIIFSEERPVGVIDFDVAGPGPKLWDVAYSLYTCVPLSRFYLSETGEKVNYSSFQHDESIRRRLRLFLESYGEGEIDGCLEMVLLRLEGLCKTIYRKAVEGDGAFQKMLDEGHLQHYQKDIDFIKENKWKWV